VTQEGAETTPRPGDLAVRMSALRRLYELIGRLNGGRSLPDVLQSVVDGVVEGLGFGVPVVNLVHADGSFEVFAVAGSDDARTELLGAGSPSGSFDAEFAIAEHWGGLRFVPHDRIPEGAITGWIPPAHVLGRPTAGRNEMPDDRRYDNNYCWVLCGLLNGSGVRGLEGGPQSSSRKDIL
jgi:hypothetical protein